LETSVQEAASAFAASLRKGTGEARQVIDEFLGKEDCNGIGTARRG
jgi:hypothetical protein